MTLVDRPLCWVNRVRGETRTQAQVRHARRVEAIEREMKNTAQATHLPSLYVALKLVQGQDLAIKVTPTGLEIVSVSPERYGCTIYDDKMINAILPNNYKRTT